MNDPKDSQLTQVEQWLIDVIDPASESESEQEDTDSESDD